MLYLEDLGCLSLCLNCIVFLACATCVTAFRGQISIVFSTCAAFVTGLQLGVRFPWCFHGSGICGSFGESEWHGVSMLGALGGQV